MQIPAGPLPFISPSAAPDATALIEADTGARLGYGELREAVAAYAAALAGPKQLVFHFTRNSLASCVSMLGALAAGHAVALINPKLNAGPIYNLLTLYRPEILIFDAPEEGLAGDAERIEVLTGAAYRMPAAAEEPIHPELALLLSTSGSTGSPKFVRHRLGGIEHNAGAIASALHMTGVDVGFGHLELHYSFGLSVLTSHLHAGAAVVLTELGLLDARFWQLAREHRVTQFPGVPFHYEMMHRLGLERLKVPDIKTMTQAGGRLDTKIQQAIHAHQSSHGGRFFVMYGQTEAGPRMTTLPHDDLPARRGSVGLPLKDCACFIEPAEGGGTAGEVSFKGPNVMLGYATSRADLGLGDSCNGTLRTGDIGHIDPDGYIFLTGRAGRLAKVTGRRINLDEIEAACPSPTAAVAEKDLIYLFCDASAGEAGAAILDSLTEAFPLPRHTYRLRSVDRIPLTNRGKIDYHALREQIG